VKYVFLGFLALLASFTIIVVSSGMANSVLYRSVDVGMLFVQENNLTAEGIAAMGQTQVRGMAQMRLQQSIARGCEPLPAFPGFELATMVRCPFWVTP
jgi:hypothetical protein